MIAVALIPIISVLDKAFRPDLLDAAVVIRAYNLICIGRQSYRIFLDIPYLSVAFCFCLFLA